MMNHPLTHQARPQEITLPPHQIHGGPTPEQGSKRVVNGKTFATWFALFLVVATVLSTWFAIKNHRRLQDRMRHDKSLKQLKP